MSKVISSIALLAGLLLAPSVRAQTAGNSVRIYAEPGGVLFQVDGQDFYNQATFLWPGGSKHTVTSYDQSAAQIDSLYQYKGWISNLSSTISNSQPITASPNLQWIKLVFDVSYQLTLLLPDCPDSATCPNPGRVEITGQGIYTTRAKFYVKANSQVEARAYPNSGYIFTGWTGIYSASFIITFTMTGPLILVPNFAPTVSVGVHVNVATEPPQLQVLLDRTPYTPPVSLEWGLGTIHTLGANPLQVVQGVTYIFESWSDGGAINHDFLVPVASTPLSFTARFVEPSFVTFATSPPGLSLSIDGRQNWPNYIFPWVPGTTHPISAPSTQTDAQGRKYRFVSWSNGKPAAFDYIAGPAPGGSTITAVYQALGQATVTSVPAGLKLQVDGAECATPCTVEKDVGASVTISAPLLANVNDQSRLAFAKWSDSSQPSRVILLSPDARTYTAVYTAQNRLSLSATPPEGAAFQTVPSSSDGFYDEGSAVSITSKPALGFRINHWLGDISATGSVTAVTLSTPITAILLLDRVPEVAPLGIRNAAAGTSSDGLAPGSLISIFGANLAPDLVVAASNPLPQILANVVVRADDTFLPLAFASPTQINAQLPSSLSEGDHTITIRWEGKPETSARISVVRNAPGLFNSGVGEQPVGLFLKADGSVVTPDRPATPGEMISILGTGLGPYAQQPPDGFLLAEEAGYTLVDHIEVLVADTSPVEPFYAGRANAGVGVDAVRFRVPAARPDSTLVSVRIRINAKDSNTVWLPVGQEQP